MNSPIESRWIGPAQDLGVGEAALSIMRLYVSPGHNYFGHHGSPPGRHPLRSVAEVSCRAGRGLEEDRFLDHAKDYRGQITFFSSDVFDELCRALGVWDKHPGVFRRNAITSGDDLNRYIGRDFTIQGIRFRGMAECSPCHWMDAAFGPGCAAYLEGQGGLRARILSDGLLRVEDN